MRREQQSENSRIYQIRDEAISQCQPYVDMIMRLRSLAVPYFVVTKDGVLDWRDGLPQESLAVIKQAQDAMDHIMEKAQEEIRKIQKNNPNS